MRVLITGDRHWKNMKVIENELKKLPSDTTIIHGDAPGADTIGAFVAERLGLKVKPFPAEWHIYKRGAGPVRNQKMLDEGKPDFILAFHDNIKDSKGTKNMINKGVNAGIKIILIENGIQDIKSQIE